MKNDTTTTVLNFVLAVLVILGVVFALMTMNRQRTLRAAQLNLQGEMQHLQIVNGKAQMLANDVMTYNTKANSPELQRILQAVTTPSAPAK
jgi:hypothetical protein